MINGINCTGGINLAEKKTFTFYSDPGHGWLEVEKQDLIALSLEGRISSFSYIDGEKVYLEEDCDASLFWKAYEDKYNTTLRYREVYQEDCFIRNLQHYRR